jgi:hypothetical protein
MTVAEVLAIVLSFGVVLILDSEASGFAGTDNCKHYDRAYNNHNMSKAIGLRTDFLEFH